MKRTRGVGVGLSLSFVLLSARGIAVPTAGRVQLSLEGQLIGYENVSLTPEGSSSSTSTTAFTGGVAAPSLGIGIGGGIGDNVLLAGRLMFASQKTTVADDAHETSQTQVTVLANPEYVFNGDAVRPFVGASLGFAHSDANPGSGPVSTNAGLFGGGLGLHYFATDSFSIDPGMFVYYETGHVSTQVANTASITASAYDVGADFSGFSFVLSVSLSGWLGGHKEKEHDAGDLPADGAAVTSAPFTPVSAPTTDPNELRALLKLSGGDRATFHANPSKGSDVEMVVIVAHEDAGLAQCAALVATSSQGSVSYGPFRVQRLGAGTEAAISLTTKTTAEALDGLLSAAGVKIEGCGQSWSVDPMQTEDLRSFVKQVRVPAAAQGAPPAPFTQPAAPAEDTTAVPGGAPDAPPAPAQQTPAPPRAQ